MNLLDIYNMKEQGQLTDEEVAKALGKSVQTVRFVWTRWGMKLPMMFSILDKIRAGTISRGEAAEALECTGREVNLLMNRWNVERPIGDRRMERERAVVKWEVRKKFAIDFIAGASTIEEAAESGQVSVRQMRRWVSELLEKHYDMAFKDLKNVTLPRRRRLAAEMEEKEGLDLAKQQLMKVVFDGRKTIQEEAADRALQKRARRRAGKAVNV